LIAFALLIFAAVPPADDPPMLRHAIKACTRNPEAVRQLFEIEKAEGLPEGLLAAAFLRESSCRPDIHCGDQGRSCGPFQLHGSHKRKAAKIYLEIHGRKPKNDPRRDLKAAATYWARKVKRGRSKAEAQCKGRGGYASRDDLLWASGNLTATWRPRCLRRKCLERAHNGECTRKVCTRFGARCAKRGRYETQHWSTLRRWREALKEPKP